MTNFLWCTVTLLLLVSSAQKVIAEDEDPLRRALRATVQIVIRDSANTVRGTGSGVLVSHDGYILTAKHVIEDYYKSPESTSILVRILDGNLTLRPEQIAEAISRDPNVDMALIRVTGEKFPFLRIGNSSMVKIDEQLVAFGFERSGGKWLTKSGRRNGLNWEVDIPLFPGSSGGPVVKSGCDMLVGIVVGGLEDPITKALIPGRSQILPSQFGAFVLGYGASTQSAKLCDSMVESPLHSPTPNRPPTSPCKEITVSETVNGVTTWAKKCL